MTTILNLGLSLFVLLAASFDASYIGRRRLGITAPVAPTTLILFAYCSLMLYQSIWTLSDGAAPYRETPSRSPSVSTTRTTVKSSCG